MVDFAECVATEQARLTKEKSDLTAKRQEIDEQLISIDRELIAIDAYVAAKAGKLLIPAEPAPKQPRTPSSTPRAPRGSKRDELLAIITDAGTITRAQILERLGVKGNKAAEQSASNALTTLKKAGALVLDGGVYSLAIASPQLATAS